MIRNRSMFVQVLLMIVTFGIYGIYWFYSVACEMRDASRSQDASPALWTVLLFVPFGAFYSIYKFGQLYERWAPDHFNRWLIFVLYLVFSPAVWFVVQSELNRAASGSGPAPALA